MLSSVSAESAVFPLLPWQGGRAVAAGLAWPARWGGQRQAFQEFGIGDDVFREVADYEFQHDVQIPALPRSTSETPCPQLLSGRLRAGPPGGGVRAWSPACPSVCRRDTRRRGLCPALRRAPRSAACPRPRRPTAPRWRRQNPHRRPISGSGARRVPLRGQGCPRNRRMIRRGNRTRGTGPGARRPRSPSGHTPRRRRRGHGRPNPTRFQPARRRRRFARRRQC